MYKNKTKDGPDSSEEFDVKTGGYLDLQYIPLVSCACDFCR